MTTTKQGFEQFFNNESYKTFINPANWNSDEMMGLYRRNMEALNSIGQATTEITRNITQAQTNYTRETMDDVSQFWRNWMSAGTNIQDKMEIQNQAAREGWNKTVSYSQELSGIIQKSQEKLMRTMNERFTETMSEAGDVAKRAAKTK